MSANNRVTRLVEFSPFGWLFTLASFFIQEFNIFRATFSTAHVLYQAWQNMGRAAI
jgi:hypothetical protein